MRRALTVALCWLMAAQPALAVTYGRVALIRPVAWPAGKQSAGEQLLYAYRGHLHAHGVDFDELPQSACPTSIIGKGTLNMSAGQQRQYVALIIMGYAVGANMTKAQGFSPDSFSLAAGWPSVPTGFVGLPSTPALSLWANAAACSTGAGTVSSFPFTGYSYNLHLTGTPYTWSTAGLTNPVPRATAPGILRTVVSTGVCAMSDPTSATSARRWEACSDCDSTRRPDQAHADTMGGLWARYRSPVEPAPLVYCWPQAGALSSPENGLIEDQLAMLDSAARVFEGTPFIQKPVEWGLYVSKGFSRGGPDAQTDMQYHGTFCYSGACDTTNEIAHMDSVGTLGLHVVVGVNPDSFATYPSEFAWWPRLGDVRYAFEPYSSAIATAPGAGNASSTAFTDAAGYQRARVPITAARLGGAVCASGDTTLACMLADGEQAIEAMWPGRRSRTFAGPNFLWLPSGASRASMPSVDSLGAAYLGAGITTVLINPDETSSSPWVSFSVNATGSFFAATPPLLSITPAERAFTIFQDQGHTQSLGQLQLLATRGQMSDSCAGAAINLSHAWNEEFENGLFGGLWYPPDLVYYFHTFRTPLHVLTVRAGELAGNANGRANAPGWYMIKWIVGQMNAANYLAGRNVWQEKFPESIRP